MPKLTWTRIEHTIPNMDVRTSDMERKTETAKTIEIGDNCSLSGPDDSSKNDLN